MNTAKWNGRARWLSVLALSLAPTHWVWADDAPKTDDAAPAKAAPAAEAAPPAEPAPPHPARPPRPPRPPRFGPGVAVSKYVLNMHLAPLPKALDEQLGLKGEGVLVGDVGPDGPAAKAGIQENDIVLAVGDQSVKQPPDLMKAVDASEGKELSLKLLRGGKPVTVTVTPAKREDERRGPPEWTVSDAPGGIDLSELRELERKIREKLKDAGLDMRMQFIQPGRFLPEGADFLFERRIEFPDDLSVDIKKTGKAPAQIEVKKGDKTWSVKENELGELPDDVRGHVEGLLGRGPMRMKIRRHGLPGGDGPGFVHDEVHEELVGPPPGGPGPDFRHGPPPPGGPHPRARRPGGPHPEAGPGDGPDRRPPGPPGLPGEHGPRGHRPPPRPDGLGPDGPRGEPVPRGRGGLERRLDELSRDLDRIRHGVEALREDLGDEEEDEFEVQRDIEVDRDE